MEYSQIMDWGDRLLLSGEDLSRWFTPKGEEKLVQTLHVNLTVDVILDPSLRKKVEQVEKIMREKEISTPWRSRINRRGQSVVDVLKSDSNTSQKSKAAAKLQIK